MKEHKRNASDMSNEDQLLLATALMQTDRKKSDKSLVCAPDPALIRRIYLPLLGYIEEIEELMKSKPGQPSSFNEFLSTHVKDVFLAKGHNRNLQLTIETLSKNHDAWRAIITPEDMKSMGLNRPLLQSTVLVENSKCRRPLRINKNKNAFINRSLFDCRNYRDEELDTRSAKLFGGFAENGVFIVENVSRNVSGGLSWHRSARNRRQTYLQCCLAQRRGYLSILEVNILQHSKFGKNELKYLLRKQNRTLPNWTDLKSSRSKLLASGGSGGKKSLKSSNLYMTSEEESPTQVQQRNIREAEMLTSNLGEGGISQQEILSDISVLKELAILQESMVSSAFDSIAHPSSVPNR